MAKIDMSEVKLLNEVLVKNTDKVKSALAETKAGLGKIKSMDSFKGKGARATKDYITHGHDNLIEVYDNIIGDLTSNLKYAMNQFSSSVDNDDSCIIDSGYVTKLETEVTGATKSISSAIKSINKEISSISDIISASKVQTSDLKSDEKEFKKIIKEMMEKFKAFIAASSSDVSQMQEFMSLLQTMQGQIQQISSVPDGIRGFDKGFIKTFKEWKKTAKNIKKYGGKAIGSAHFIYHVAKGNIKVTWAVNGKVRVRVMNPKALVGKVKWDSATRTLKYSKRWKIDKSWK